MLLHPTLYSPLLIVHSKKMPITAVKTAFMTHYMTRSVRRSATLIVEKSGADTRLSL